MGLSIEGYIHHIVGEIEGINNFARLEIDEEGWALVRRSRQTTFGPAKTRLDGP